MKRLLGLPVILAAATGCLETVRPVGPFAAELSTIIGPNAMRPDGTDVAATARVQTSHGIVQAAFVTTAGPVQPDDITPENAQEKALQAQAEIEFALRSSPTAAPTVPPRASRSTGSE